MNFQMSNYIAIHAEDVDQASAYYQTVFGLKLKGKEPGVNFLEADPFVICVTNGTKNKLATEFVVENAKEAEAWLLDNGCTVVERYENGQVRYFEDRYGLLFHLWEKK